MEDLRLEVGKIYGNKELAEWFGITDRSFKTLKKKKLEELKKFVEFKTLKGGKIEVIKILSEEPCIYVKKRSELYQYCKEKTPKVWIKGEPETSTRVALKIWDVSLDREWTTIAKYVSEIRNDLWGNPKDEIGCKYILAKMYRDKDNYARYIALNNEELDYLSDLHKKFYPILDQKDKIVQIQEAVKKKKISKEKAWTEIFGEEDIYCSFIKQASKHLGCDWIVRATLVWG